MTDSERLDRLSAAVEKLVDQLAYASLPAVMTKVRAARELGCSAATVARMVRRGELKLTKAGKVPASEVLRLAFVEGRERPSTKASRYDARAEAQAGRALLRGAI